MTAPLSLRDKQYQYLAGLYGPGLSYNDMLAKNYNATGKSISDAMDAYYSGSGSLSDRMYAALSGSGSLSDKQYGDSTGGLSKIRTNIVSDPRYTTVTNKTGSCGSAANATKSIIAVSDHPAGITTAYRATCVAAQGAITNWYVGSSGPLGVITPQLPYGKWIRGGAWVRMNVDHSVGFRLIAVSGSGSSTGSPVAVTANVWTWVTHYFQFPPSTDTVTALSSIIIVTAGANPAINDTMDIAGHIIEVFDTQAEAQAALPASLYFDGDTVDTGNFQYDWSGTVNNSTSTARPLPTPAYDLLMKTSPFYVAHRGSGDVWPEHTATAYANSLAAGLKAIEVSAQRSSDGWWFCLHDAGASGLDRTTNGTGDPKTFTQAQLNTYIVDIANCGPYWPTQNLKMPDLQTVLTSILTDSSTVVFFETKDYSGAAMDDIIAKLQTWFPTKYKTQIIWKSHVSNAPGFTKAKAVGMRCWAYIDYPLVNQDVLDAMSRADYVGLPRYDNGNGLTDAEVDTAMGLIGSTVKAISWEPKRRSEIAKLLAKGVDGFVSPSSPYTSIATANRTQDQFSTGRWAPGDIIRDTSVGAILDIATASMFFNGTATGASVCLGSMCPIASTSYEIEYEMKYDVVPAATSHSGLVLCKADDGKYAFGGTSNTTGGYHIVMRQNGQLQLYKHDPGSATGTQVGTTLTTAVLDTVTWCKVRIKVTPTNVEIQRMDGTPSAIMNVADVSYRGQYIHLSKNHASTTEFVRFRNVKVTPL